MKTIFCFLFILPTTVFAWGGRGHATVCEAAVYLTKEKGLKEYLQNKPQMMGHLCNMPDFYWKSLSPELTKKGNPAHWVDPEVIGLTVKEMPLSYEELIKNYTGKENKFKGGTIFSVHADLGSNWWRADQMFRKAVALKDDFSKAVVPANGKEEQDDKLLFNKTTLDFITYIGLMGHFVGDNGQPFHVTANHDGYATGNGGIHSYYEDYVVANQPFDLLYKVVKQGQSLQEQSKKGKVSFLKPGSVLERMKSLAEISFTEIDKISKLDPIKKKSEEKKEKGMLIRTPAERAPAETVAKKYEPLIVIEMARSAALLAQFWDEAYLAVGKPQLKSFKSYKYPFTIEFIEPDYLTSTTNAQ